MNKTILLFSLAVTCILFSYYLYYSGDTTTVSPIVNNSSDKNSSRHGKRVGVTTQQEKNANTGSDSAKVPARRQHLDEMMRLWDARERQKINKQMRSKKGQNKAIASYKDLLTELKLPPDKITLFKDLLVEYAFMPDNTYLDMRFGGEGKLTQALIQDQIDIKKKELMENFKTLLTDEQYVYLEYYMKTQPWRGSASRLAISMEKNCGEKLTPENREAFIGLIADANESLRNTTHGFSSISDGEWSAHTKQYIMDNGGKLLTPSQMKWLGQHYDELIGRNKR